jgi:hypothetical protein
MPSHLLSVFQEETAGSHGGQEIKHTAVSTVQAAQQAQRDLVAGEVRARIGLDAGDLCGTNIRSRLRPPADIRDAALPAPAR